MAMQPMQAPQEAPAEAAQEGEAAPKGGVSEFIVGLDQGLSKLAAMMGQAEGIDPSALEDISAAREMFMSGVQKMLGKGAGPQPAQGPAQAEMGANKNAVPAM